MSRELFSAQSSAPLLQACQLMPGHWEPLRYRGERTNVLDVPHARGRDRRHPRLLRVLGILAGVDALDGRVDLGEWFRHVGLGWCEALVEEAGRGVGCSI